VGRNEKQICGPVSTLVSSKVTAPRIFAYNRPLLTRKPPVFIRLQRPTRSCHIWHRGAIYRTWGQEYISNRAALGGGLINRRPKTQIESGAFCFAREKCETVSKVGLFILPGSAWSEVQKVKIPTPSTSLRAGSVAQSATRMGHPSFPVEVRSLKSKNNSYTARAMPGTEEPFT
jgi:hypothetical protein